MKIALCDDIPLLRRMLEAMIREYEARKNVRFQIRQFGSGEELLKQAEEEHLHFDLIFLDQCMKKLSGSETALRIRKYDTACQIVFCTGSGAHPQFAEASPLRILEKPIDMEDIYVILDEVRSSYKLSGSS
ncbi:LytR/AlgR family response regulator transcription factor [Desulfitobacterium chlororespirans]|uniref:Stage 0 sporulation protein A homolog n=1 Tax=Desulfitobacterium chlororespirans DSM 11544 TaxID=1121395 RepID=A0A1M7TIG4_9FIRM|nr:response regulator [Desulfitobacterium chlororespirans]SHN70471.1 Response regulator receiver domain-containing protein [Desulfitobacterium chlororespirans DSM 11544]